MGQTVCTEIIVCTIPLLMQLKGVKECTEWLALEFLIETTWQQHLILLFHLLSFSLFYLEQM